MSKDKVKTVFFCTECGYESPKWMGQCPGCKAWNTFKEGLDNKQSVKGSPSTKRSTSEKTAIIPVSKVEIKKEDKIKTNIGELDRVLGGGIVWGSLTLIGGDPGIGKSTLLLQICGLRFRLGSSCRNAGRGCHAKCKSRCNQFSCHSHIVRLLYHSRSAIARPDDAIKRHPAIADHGCRSICGMSLFQCDCYDAVRRYGKAKISVCKFRCLNISLT